MSFRFPSRNTLVALAVLLRTVAVLAQAPQAPRNVVIVAPNPVAPAITALSPSSGNVGATVTISGVNFNASAGTGGSVTFNGVAATVTSWANTSLTTTVPSGATTGNVVVVQNGLTSGGSSFTVTTGSVANPIAAVRVPSNSQTAPDSVWALRGVEGGIPTTFTNCASAPCTTLFGGTVTQTTINNALTSCGTNEVVRVPAGSFSVGAITFSKSNCILRGQGAGTGGTKLTITSNIGRCHLSQSGAISFCAASANIGLDSPDNTGTWAPQGASGSWVAAMGTTVITLSSVANMVMGSTILFLDQQDDTVDGYPLAGDIWACSSGADTQCSNQGGGSNYARAGRTMTTVHKVTNISGVNVTIDPPIYVPNFRQAKSPGAWWGNTGNIIRNAGIEDMTVDFSGTGNPGLQVVNATNVWFKGMRWIYFAAAATDVFHNMIVNCFRCTFRDSYYYGPTGAPATQNYQISPHVSGSLLTENNILESVISGFVPNGPTSASVFAYNFSTGATYTGPCIIEHGFTMMNLYEGNNCLGILLDVIHAPHDFITAFRNHFDGTSNNPSSNVNTTVSDRSHTRFVNVVGNVLGKSGQFTTYLTDQARGDTSIYSTGWQSDDSTNPPTSPLVPNDPRAKVTLLRWGNWDTVTNATRWCGNSSNTGWVGVCASTTEVPTTLTSYANTLPATETLPPSLYLSAKPSFVGVLPWPLIGPDVTGGNITGYGGHANKIPARVCWEAATNDPAYPTSSPRIKIGVASACVVP